MQTLRVLPRARSDRFVVRFAVLCFLAFAGIGSIVHLVVARSVEDGQRWRIDAALGFGLVALYLLVLPLALRTSRTVREQAARLDERTRQLSAIVAQMPAVVWSTDDQLRLTESVGAGLQGIGLEPNEHRGVLLSDVFGTEDPAHPVLSSHRRALEGEAVVYEVEFRGRVFQGCVQPLRAGRVVVGTVGAAFDVTDGRLAERSLDRLQRQHALILEAAGEGIIGVGIRGNVTFVNAAAGRMLGWQGHELLGRGIHAVAHHSLPHGAPYPADECPTNLVLQDATTREVTNEVFWRRDGTSFDVEYVVAPLRMDDRLIGAVMVFRDVSQRLRDERELRRNFTLLRRSHEERRRLVGQLVKAEEEERRRIAGDIHDDSLQTMAAVAMHLYNVRRYVEDVEAGEALDALEETVRTSIGRLRHLLFALRPPTLDREGLTAALKLLLTETIEPFGPSVRMDSRVSAEPPPETRTILYRIAQEALVNVRKHAHARMVEVVIEEQGGGYVVCIVDDGRGTSVDVHEPPKPGHFGLSAMRERAEAAGGWFRFDSAPGGGTTVEFFIPTEGLPAAGAIGT